jgi:hypothetical protein
VRPAAGRAAKIGELQLFLAPGDPLVSGWRRAGNDRMCHEPLGGQGRHRRSWSAGQSSSHLGRADRCRVHWPCRQRPIPATHPARVGAFRDTGATRQRWRACGDPDGGQYVAVAGCYERRVNARGLSTMMATGHYGPRIDVEGNRLRTVPRVRGSRHAPRNGMPHWSVTRRTWRRRSKTAPCRWQLPWEAGCPVDHARGPARRRRSGPWAGALS